MKKKRLKRGIGLIMETESYDSQKKINLLICKIKLILHSKKIKQYIYR